MKEYTTISKKNTNVTVTIQGGKSIYLFITLMKKNSFLFSLYLDSSFQSRKRLYNHKCLFVRPFVRSSVINQNPSTARNHHPSSFNLHPSSLLIHPSSFFIHPSFILRLLIFSACLLCLPLLLKDRSQCYYL